MLSLRLAVINQSSDVNNELHLEVSLSTNDVIFLWLISMFNGD